MKTILVKDCNGKILIHIKKIKGGYDGKVANDISGKISIVITEESGERIKMGEVERKGRG